MITKFAKNSEVKMIVEEKQIATNQFKRFLSKKGIFSLVSGAETLANQTYQIFLGSADIEYLQDVMQTSNSYQKSSMIVLNPNSDYEKLDEFIDEISDNIQENRLSNSKYKIENIHKDVDGNLNVKMSYTNRIKGKTELIKNRTKEVEIKIMQLSDEKKLAIDIRQNDNTDIKEIESFIKEINSDDSKLFEVEKITLDKLTSKNKINLFDKLIKSDYSKWTLEDIKGIDVQRSDKSDIDDDNFDEDGEIVSQDELIGIKTAVFKGSSIRDTGIVKKFEKQGFYFISMRFMYTVKETMESFIIDINFKGTDDIKIDIVKNFEKDEKNKDLAVVFPKSQQEEIICEFQSNVYKIYKDLIDSQQKKSIAKA